MRVYFNGIIRIASENMIVDIEEHKWKSIKNDTKHGLYGWYGYVYLEL